MSPPLSCPPAAQDASSSSSPASGVSISGDVMAKIAAADAARAAGGDAAKAADVDGATLERMKRVVEKARALAAARQELARQGAGSVALMPVDDRLLSRIPFTDTFDAMARCYFFFCCCANAAAAFYFSRSSRECRRHSL